MPSLIADVPRPNGPILRMITSCIMRNEGKGRGVPDIAACRIHMWTAPACKGFEDRLAAWSGAWRASHPLPITLAPASPRSRNSAPTLRRRPCPILLLSRAPIA
jgi:hypothetical protein